MRRPLLLLLPLALAACGPSAPPEASAPTPATETETPAIPDAAPADHSAMLESHHWRLVEAKSANGARIDALIEGSRAPLQLDFADGGVRVSNVCNRMSANAALDDDRVAVDQVISTLMACPDEALAARERAIGERLPGTHRIALRAGEPVRLTMTLENGDVLTFHGRQTPAARYGSAGDTMFLEIAPQRVDCNHPLMPGHRCLQAREVQYDDEGLRSPGDADWAPMFEDIEGFTHEDGVRNVVRVTRYQVPEPAADASAQAYVLDMVVESEKAAD